MTVDLARLSLSQAADAAGVAREQLRSWVEAGLVPFGSGDPTADVAPDLVPFIALLGAFAGLGVPPDTLTAAAPGIAALVRTGAATIFIDDDGRTTTVASTRGWFACALPLGWPDPPSQYRSHVAEERTRTSLLRTDEAAELAGLTVRQLDHWARLAIVHAAHDVQGSGRRRRWDLKQVPMLRALGRLSSAGCQLDVLRRAAPGIEKLIDEGAASIGVGTTGECFKAEHIPEGIPVCWIVFPEQ